MRSRRLRARRIAGDQAGRKPAGPPRTPRLDREFICRNNICVIAAHDLAPRGTCADAARARGEGD